jgi:hypothetical protein
VKKFNKLLILPLLGLMFIWMAVAPPDTFTQTTARAYGSVTESGDILLLVHYDIDYISCCPAESIVDTIIAAWYDTSAGTIANTTSPTITGGVSSGYGQGAIGMYLSAAEVTAAAIVWNDADFSNLFGNPSFFSTPPFNQVSIEWRAESGRTAIGADVLSLGSSLQGSTRWVDAGKTLVENGVLTGEGESYFQAVIPGLRAMAPDLYSGSMINPDFYERDFGDSYTTTLDNYWVGSAFENQWDTTADWLNLPVIFVRVLATILIGSVVCYSLVRMTGQPLLIVPVMGMVLASATIINWVPLQLTAILGFFALMVTGFALWLKRAT